MSIDSKKYWENRYKINSNSGAGSYGYLKNYKLDILNNFIGDNKISSIIDFGCGDGNQIDGLKINEYNGYDVSQSAINICKKKYNNNNFQFYVINDYTLFKKCELGLSLDVIYHLIENHVFEEYMEHLFKNSIKYIVIYSNDYEAEKINPLTNKPYAPHVKPRNFTKYIEDNFPEWKLDKKIINPHHGKPGVWSDFFFYSKLNH